MSVSGQVQPGACLVLQLYRSTPPVGESYVTIGPAGPGPICHVTPSDDSVMPSLTWSLA